MAISWVERYRPSSLVDVSGNEHVIHALRSYLSIDDMPHLLLHGPPGSGKTSAILAIARQFYGGTVLSSVVLELNASDVRGVHTMRNQIQPFTKCLSVIDSTAVKLVVFDEADRLTNLSQCALGHLIDLVFAVTTSTNCHRVHDRGVQRSDFQEFRSRRRSIARSANGRDGNIHRTFGRGE